jgi:hypothetical protein
MRHASYRLPRHDLLLIDNLSPPNSPERDLINDTQRQKWLEIFYYEDRKPNYLETETVKALVGIVDTENLYIQLPFAASKCDGWQKKIGAFYCYLCKLGAGSTVDTTLGKVTPFSDIDELPSPNKINLADNIDTTFFDQEEAFK